VTETAPRSIDFLYFSYVTLTTVGYGDLTAAGDLGRMLAVTEALLGQLYLVTVVALVIGNIGRERTRA
jgi:voltage-gated potassium channel Kch